MNIDFRKATINDLKDICILNNNLFKLEKENYDETLIDNWPLTKPGKDYFKEMILHNYVQVAVANKKIIGYLAGTINEKGSYENIQYGEINNMYIDSWYQGQKIGTKLIDDFKNHLKSNNISNIKVIASYKNLNAIKFYKRNGLEEFNIELTQKF